MRYNLYRNMVVDAKDDDIQWITVKGNHIPIKKGQSKEEAVKEFFESKGKSSGGKSESKKVDSKKARGALQNALKNVFYSDEAKGYGYQGPDDFSESDEDSEDLVLGARLDGKEVTKEKIDKVKEELENFWKFDVSVEAGEKDYIYFKFKEKESGKVDNSKNSGNVYKNTMKKVREFKAKSDGTYDFNTGKPKDYPDGYSVSFHQNEPDEDGNWKSDYGRYTEEDYDKNVSEMVKESGGELNIGYFSGTPEVSVWVKGIKEAKKLMKKHNQHSIWDWKAGDVILNPYYDPKKNPMKE
ncbi:MAG: hypothetical protein IIZ94_04660 [Prevotella sp.]|nr:hypothetical protein [Prevotella sp.]